MRVLAWAALATALACGAAQAQTKKELVARVLQLAQPTVEQLARSIVEQPAAQLLHAANARVAQLPADKRDAVVAEIRADVKRYVDETAPLLRERAIKLMPGTIGPAFEQNFSEDELRQLIAWLESPLNRKYQQFAPTAQKQFVEKLVAESRFTIESRLKGLEASIAQRLGLPARAPASAPSAPAKK